MTEGFVYDNTNGLITWDGKPICGPGVANVIGPFACSSGLSPNEAVRLSTADTIDLAQADVVSERPTIGFVLTKPTATLAYVLTAGEMGGFVGLVPGATYYLSETPGQITDVAPMAQGSIVQEVGWASNATTLVIGIVRDFVLL
jgi:hypothetical protein